MGVTANYSFPYPDNVDPVAIPLDMQELAAAIDAKVYDVAAAAVPEIVYAASAPGVPTVGLVWIDSNG